MEREIEYVVELNLQNPYNDQYLLFLTLFEQEQLLHLMLIVQQYGEQGLYAVLTVQCPSFHLLFLLPFSEMKLTETSADF